MDFYDLRGGDQEDLERCFHPKSRVSSDDELIYYIQRKFRISYGRRTNVVFDGHPFEEIDIDKLVGRYGQRTALHRASWSDENLGLIKTLVELGADVNSKSSDGSTPLIKSVDNRAASNLYYLIDVGADLYQCNRDGEDVFSAIIWQWSDRSCRDFLKYVIDKRGVDVNKPITSDRCVSTLLIEVVESGLILSARFLVSKGADVNQQDQNGFTPIMRVFDINNRIDLALVEFLVNEAKADLTLKNNDEKTVLDLIDYLPYYGDRESRLAADLIRRKYPK